MNADGGAELRTWKIVVHGASGVASGPIMVSSQLANLTIAAPYLGLAFQAASVDQGKEVDMAVKVAKAVDFPGEATVTLIGLPNKVTTDVKKITKDTTDLMFHIKTDKVSPAGNHASLFCQVVITQNGEPIVHNIGTGALRIDVPLPPKANAPAPAAGGRGATQARRRSGRQAADAAREAQARNQAGQDGQMKRSEKRSNRFKGYALWRGLSVKDSLEMILASSSISRVGMCCLLVVSLAGAASAGDNKLPDLPADVFVPAKSAPLASLAVFPSEISLTTARDRQSVVVQATFADGITRDVTKEATLTLADAKPVRREGAVFYPAADGATTLSVSFGGQTVAVPVKVAQASVAPPISFRLDVMPVFMRSGCNTGSCHGAARGKDGFRISLFGFDPEGDHFRLTREMVGRRINRAVPAESTLLEKATGAVPHTGGKRFEPSSELYRTLHTWIQTGASNDDAAKVPTVVGVDLYPKQAVLDGKGVDPAVDGPRPLLRRHRSRRHQPGCFPHQ